MINLSEREAFYKSDFTDNQLTVTIPRFLKSYRLGASSLDLETEAIVTQKETITVSALMQARAFQYTGKRKSVAIRLDFFQNGTIRYRQNADCKITEKKQPMILGNVTPDAEVTLREDEEKLLLQTDDVLVEIQKDPFQVIIKKHGGQTLIGQYNDDMHSVVQDRRRGFKEDGSITDDFEKEKLSFPSMECFPCCHIANHENGRSAWCFTSSVAYNENFYGLGEQFSRINKAGQDVTVWTVNPVGVSSDKAYKPVPFVMSSRGYGVYSNSPRKTVFKMGEHNFKTWSCEVQDERLDLFIFTGSYPKLLNDYASLTGKSKLPPKWSFGVWMARNCYRSSEEMLEVARQLRTREIPCDVLHLDWAYCKGEFDFAFDTQRFPDPAALGRTLKDNGFHWSIWNLPYQKFTSPIFDEGVKRGAFAKHDDGRIADMDAQEAVIDFSAEGGRQFYADKIIPLLEAGVQVIKTDFGENAQEHLVYAGADGRDMHNLYPLFYNQTAMETMEKVWGDDCLVWGRSAFSGCQRYPVYWGGDSDSDFLGMYHTLRGGLSIGLSGFPFWSHDVGGYFCAPDKEVYIRWLQFGMFSPLVRFHGTSAREPWAFGETAVEQYQKYAALRYSLMEYIYSQAQLCVSDATPMLRALVLDYSHDPAVANIDDQYLFGRDILVAPVFSSDGYRMVYLPLGDDWIDYHTKRRYSGGQWLTVPTPIDIMPIYLKSGSVIPFVESMSHVHEKAYQNLEMVIVSSDHPAIEKQVETDQLHFALGLALNSGELRIEWSIQQSLRVQWRIFAQGINNVAVNGRDVAFQRDGESIVF